MHLQVDGYVDCVLNEAQAKQVVYILIRLVNMTPVGEFIYLDTHLGPSGYQLLMESHVCFDYYNDYIAVDLFSCNTFDHREATEFIQTHFHITTVCRREVYDRGFPTQSPVNR